ncbi:hypothetical protein J5N97_029783 [Dioscorea zingiberensis]|uniref:F-box domain-containing protein n=1 Tax=Dioscorea zingiberensis TaxID=325984 RepID=A0A9D5BWH7_9LILI|nr:hypothetical protein J5N97_029783 [Dioscorea zingiberensis]
MKNQCGEFRSLEDIAIAIAIATHLKVWDVCSLGSCSRFWRALRVSDYLWLALSRKRTLSMRCFKRRMETKIIGF